MADSLARIIAPPMPPSTTLPGASDSARAIAGETDSTPERTDGAAVDLLQRWLGLSELERRAFVALAREITQSSTLVETSTLDLSARFQLLARIAQDQIKSVKQVVSVAECLDVDGRTVPLREAMQTVENVLRKVIDTIVGVSKHAMRMVYALEDVASDVDGAISCVARIKAINTQTRYLALNASIEAHRSGAAGAAFGVIANELKDLSHETERTSREVQDRIAAITGGMRKGRAVLQEIATIDMSEHIMAKQELNNLIEAVMAQNRSFTEILGTTAAGTSEMAQTVGQLITGMQFQDRTKQHLEHVVSALGVLADATAAMEAATRTVLPRRFEKGVIDQAWLDRIVENQTLGAVKQRMLQHLLEGGETELDAAADVAPTGAGSGEDDIELF